MNDINGKNTADIDCSGGAVSKDKAVAAVSKDNTSAADGKDKAVVAGNKDKTVVAVSKDKTDGTGSKDKAVVACSKDKTSATDGKDKTGATGSKEKTCAADSKDKTGSGQQKGGIGAGKEARRVDTESIIREAVIKYGDVLYRVCVVILCNEQDAQDAVQDTFCRYIEKRPVFNDEEHEKA